MVKSELIQRIVSKQRTLSPKDVELGVNQLLEHMSIQLAQNNRIEIRGVGSFSLHYRPARNAHNPKTGAKVYTLETHMPHFKAGKELKARVNRPDKPPLVADNDDEGDEE